MAAGEVRPPARHLDPRSSRWRGRRAAAGRGPRRGPVLEALTSARAYGLLVAAVCGLAATWLSWPAVQAALGQGVTGTFTALEHNECSRGLQRYCSWSGTFDSDDGTTHLPDVLLSTDGPWTPGDSVAVVYEGPWPDTAQVFLADGDTQWVPVAVMGAASAGFVAVMGAAHLRLAAGAVRRPRER